MHGQEQQGSISLESQNSPPAWAHSLGISQGLGYLVPIAQDLVELC